MTRPNNWFENNPKKTAGILIFILFLFCDIVFEKLYYPVIYDPSSPRETHIFYHHGLKANIHSEGWYGHIHQIINTNSLGFKDRSVHEVPAKTNKWRIVFLGDSFTEGLGVPYEETFVGILDRMFRDKGYDILNAGAVSSSPVVYYNKTRYLLEEKKMVFDEIFVFIDISDIHDEYLYVNREHFQPHLHEDIGERARKWIDQVLTDNSFTYHTGKLAYRYVRDKDVERGMAWWTLEKDVFDSWGRIGLASAEDNMQKLADLCRQRDIRLTIAVYPWTNLVERRDLDSLQVRVWGDFARRNKIGFLNLFPLFINDTPANIINDRYCIHDDIHWNEAGHQLVADAVAEVIRKADRGRRQEIKRSYTGTGIRPSR